MAHIDENCEDCIPIVLQENKEKDNKMIKVNTNPAVLTKKEVADFINLEKKIKKRIKDIIECCAKIWEQTPPKNILINSVNFDKKYLYFESSYDDGIRIEKRDLFSNRIILEDMKDKEKADKDRQLIEKEEEKELEKNEYQQYLKLKKKFESRGQ